MVNFNDFQITLPVIGTVGGLGLAAGVLIFFLVRRKKTISFKV